VSLGERRRKLAFAGAALMLLGSAGLLALRDPGPAPRRDVRPERLASPPAIRSEPLIGSAPDAIGDSRGSPPSASPATSTTPYPVSDTRGESEARNAPAVSPRDAHEAAAAARAFLEGYLPYSYGRSDAGKIRAAAWRLLRELEASPPRVLATVARARPRLISVRAAAATGGSNVDVVAVVEDGQRRYRIPLAVRHAGHRWIVTAVRG
jgi:hypothetical protein